MQNALKAFVKCSLYSCWLLIRQSLISEFIMSSRGVSSIRQGWYVLPVLVSTAWWLPSLSAINNNYISWFEVATKVICNLKCKTWNTNKGDLKYNLRWFKIQTKVMYNIVLGDLKHTQGWFETTRKHRFTYKYTPSILGWTNIHLRYLLQPEV